MTDAPAYNLLEEPWILCIDRHGEPVGDLGLREVLARASNLAELTDPSPLVTASLYRLMVAVLHSALDGPKNTDAWAALWNAGALPMDRIDAYLDRWHDRFELFHPVHPFYQRADLEAEYAKPVNILVHDMPTEKGATLFDHTSASTIQPLTAAAAARALVATQTFDTGGMKSLRKEEDTKLYKSADGSPLLKGVVLTPRGASLFETLLLNLVRYDPGHDRPFRARNGDPPAWERDGPTEAADVRPDGYRHLLTWQSRRIRLLPAQQADGTPTVPHAIVMKGNQFPDDWDNHDKEQMLAWQKRVGAASGEAAWFPVGFRLDRALWRDSTVLFAGSGAPDLMPPPLFRWLAELRADGILPDRLATLDLDGFGVTTDQAKIQAWRHERLVLPLAVIDNPGAIAAIREAIDFAGDTNGIGANKSSVGELARSLDLEAAYWPALDPVFPRFLSALPDDIQIDEHGNQRTGATALPDWAEAVCAAARSAVDRLRGVSGDSARTLKAYAKAESAFGGRLARQRRDFLVRNEGGL